jgi:hypothetical protein
MKSTLVVLLASLSLWGCAVVPVAPPVAYVGPRVVVPAPVVVVRPWYHRWWWRG